MKKLIAAILCCCAIAVSASVSAISASAVKTTCDTYSGSNAEEQNYSRAYASPIESYLTKTSSGGLMRVQGDAVDGKILVEYYDSSYNITSSKTVSAELPIFGGFYESRDNYYIISGQENLSENNSLEVYRITKYDKSWNKIKSCGLYGANTYIPFDAGSARMTDDGSYLLIRTCHEMYASDDGLHHQANVTIQVDMASMTITDYFAGVMNNSCGYVSHSFNQFIKVENGHIIAVDHGDAYPRSIVLTKYNTNYTSGKFFPSSGSPCTVTDLLTFPGKTGDNYTGASVGGFEISDSTYIVAGNYVGDSAYSSSNSSSTRNIFVATLAKNSSQPTVNMLTSYTTGTASTPHLVKLGANSFMLLWSHDGKVYYTKLDGYGKQSGSIYSMSGKLSDCVPLVYNGKLVWYVWENETVTFYSIDTTSLSSNSKTEINNGHKFTTKVAANSNIAVQTCTQCGFQRNITVLTDFDVYWNSDGGSTYHSRCDDTYHPGDTLNLWVLYDSADNTDMVYEVSDSSVAQLSGTKYYNRASIAMKTTGTFTLKIYPRYNTSCVQSYTFTVQHDYDSGKITKAATCSATGVKTYTCNTCGATKTETVAKTAHSYDSGKITKAATCTATGVKTYTCTKCSATKTETVAKTAHSYDSGKVTKAATCAATGVKTFTCSVCGATKTETIAKTTSHKYDSGKVTKPATCAATGVKTYTCSVCGATKTETIAKTTSHKYDSGKVTKPATCKATGVRTYTCSVCGTTKTESIAKTTSHKYDSGKVTKPATCAATGVRTYTCSVCGATKTETIAKTTSHKYDSGKVTKAATCKATGVKTYTCSVCGATKTESIAKTTSHKYDNGKVTKVATCATTGVKTYTCSVCGATKTETIAKTTSHKYDSGKVTKPATCAATGVKTYTCSVCGATKTETIAKTTSHKYDSGKVTKPATCAATGVKTYTCSVCGATKTETIAKTTSHKYDSGKVTKAATCKATGVKTYTCSVCGATKTETIAKTTSHKYDSGKVTKPATCAATGVKTYTCSVCGATKTETIAKTTSHKYDSGKVTKPATCAATGVKTYTCSVCGATKTETIAKTTSHKYDNGKVTRVATCATTGVKTYTCSVCGATKTESIAKTTSHKYDSGKVTKAATCKATGVKTYTCSVCGATKTETIAKTTSHKYDSGKVTKPATCKATGVRTYTCSICGATKTESIAKTTSHKYDSGKVTKAATCAEEGITTYTCTVCGVTKTATTEKTTTHSYDGGTITTEATYGAAGVKTYTCTVCGAKKTSSIAKKTIKKLTAKTTYTCTTNAVRINWNKLSGVTGYKIFRYDDAKKKWVAVKAVYDPNETNYKISGLKAGKVYKFRVKAFVKENNKFYFGESCSTISTATRPNTTTVTKANKTSSAVRLFWKKTTCTGYRILRYDSAKKKWVRVTAVGSSATTQYKISGLKKNTTYKFKVQPYVKVGSKVIDGAASKEFTVKTSK